MGESETVGGRIPSARGQGKSRSTRRSYRSKLELFRDLLVATRYASKRTRIIGLANLNPETFHKHMALAGTLGLVAVDGSDYRLTERAEPVLVALQDVLARSQEIDGAVQALERSILPQGEELAAEVSVRHHISRIAWVEIQRLDRAGAASFPRSGGPVSRGSAPPSRDLLDVLSALRAVPQYGGPSPLGIRAATAPPSLDSTSAARRRDGPFTS
jgi:predicted transcriptional regulator